MAIAIPFNSISISTEVFQNNQIIRTADLSNTPFVNNNMNAAFRNCYNLTTIYNMNTNVTNMTATFYSCHNLTNIPSIPNSVTTIGDMLADCTNFNKTITIPNSVTYMRGTFYKCTNLKNAPTTIPSSVTNMFGTFSECTNLVNVPNSIPNSVTNTGSLFYNCNKITSAPNISSTTLNVITAFYGCTNLTGNIYIHSPIITCAASCFSNTSLMKNVYIPYYNLYTNKTNCPTRNSFVSAGYTENGSNYGVYLKNLTPLLTINPTPSDATVTLIANNRTLNATSIAVQPNTTVTYTVSKSGYITNTGSFVVNTVNRTEQIVLPQLCTFTINPTPSNATVTLTATGYTQQGNSITVPSGTTVSYSVAKSNCITTTGSEVITSTHTTNVSVKCKLTVNTDPIDASVTFSTGTVSGHDCTVPYNTTVTYYASKSGYVTSDPQSITLTSNTPVSVTLVEELFTLTINPTPLDATVTLTASGYTQSGNSIAVRAGTNVNYDVSKTQYIHQVDNITINSNTVLNMQMHNYLDWQPSSVDLTLGYGNFYASCYGNGKFVAINSSNEIMISTNGVNWNKAKDDNLSFRLYWYALTYGNGKFVAIDYKGYISTSTDGLHWTVATQNTQLGSLQSDNWRALAYTGSKFVLLSEDFSISTSTDGTTWTTPVSVYPGYSGYFGSLAYDGNKLIAINTRGNISTSNDDGTTWTTPTSSSSFNSGYGLCYGIGKYVSINGYGISVSTDLQNWTTGIAVQPSYTLYNIVYAFGKFIIISTNGYIYTSTDGTTWTSGNNVINMPDSGWNTYVKSENKIVLINYNGYYATSTDNGTTWTLRESTELATVNYWDGIAYNNNKYVILNANGYISISTDGITWTTPIQDTNLSTGML